MKRCVLGAIFAGMLAVCLQAVWAADGQQPEASATLPELADSNWEAEPQANRNRADVEEDIAELTAMTEVGDEGRRLKLYKRIAKKSTNPRNRAISLIAMGNMEFTDGEYLRAFKAYEEAVDKYANLIPLDKVLAQEFHIANRYFQQPPSSTLRNVLNERSNMRAREVYDHIIRSAPYSYWAAISGFWAGIVQRWQKEHLSSAAYLRTMINRFGDSANADIQRLVGSAMVELAQSLKAGAESSDGDMNLMAEARSWLQRFLQEYPEHSARELAQELLKELNEVEAQRLLYLGNFYLREAHRREPAAQRYLQQVLDGYAETAAAADARQLLADLTATESTVVPESTPEAMPDRTPVPVDKPNTLLPPAADTSSSQSPGAPATPVDENEKWLLPIHDL